MLATHTDAQLLLKKMIRQDAEFREGQWQAINELVNNHKKLLLVQKTGWGKSIVYFISTKLLRNRGAGPTLVISPLLALIRNQIQMAKKFGIQAETINSTNPDDWDDVIEKVAQDQVDVLFISPERLANNSFRNEVLPIIPKGIGLFVIDEAHCISDWGHDFRPDYRRIKNLLIQLPDSTAVACTTATANDRVVNDISAQLGKNLEIIRGPLARESLYLSIQPPMDKAQRLAWITENLDKMDGSGIIYCLTVRDTELVTNWLGHLGYNVEAYFGNADDREIKEYKLINNEIKTLVATVALGMGFDKPDIGFIIHFQRPGSVIAYYQQVGRAGRAIDQADVVLLNGSEDDEIVSYFIRSAFPPDHILKQTTEVIAHYNGIKISQIQGQVNAPYKIIKQTLKLLDINGVIYKENSEYYRSTNPIVDNSEMVQRIFDLRKSELAEMQNYLNTDSCMMRYLCNAMDDHTNDDCGKCSNCTGIEKWKHPSDEMIEKARVYINTRKIEIRTRKRFIGNAYLGKKINIDKIHKTQNGRALCRYNQGELGKLVSMNKYKDNHFSDRLIIEAVKYLSEKWFPEIANPPKWITAIPSRRRPHLVDDLAIAISEQLHLSYIPVITRIADAPEQKTMDNSVFQTQNVINSLKITSQPPNSPVLLIDDIFDSRWTMTVAGWMLLDKGSGPVYPFTLADASKGGS